jgi:DNA-directed RNA polymerase subunit RPC12/RpoP
MEHKAKPARDFVCLECGRRMTARAAERATTGNDGCPGCGGVDIDLYVPKDHHAGEHLGA